MRVQVTAEVKTKAGISKKSGKPYEFRLQAAVAEFGVERRQFWFEQPGGNPLAPGAYEYTPSFTVNAYGELELGRAFNIAPLKVN
jgi:hypothetical protein